MVLPGSQRDQRRRPFLAPTQKTNLALLIGAILKKRTLCLSELARAYPTPKERRIAAPKHDLLHRIKRLWRFVDNGRVDALEVQACAVRGTREPAARLSTPTDGRHVGGYASATWRPRRGLAQVLCALRAMLPSLR